MKKQNGITLIALVITIIVLLILAGVSIAMLAGEGGILGKATTATTNTLVAEVDEAIKLAASEIVANKMDPTYEGTEDKVNATNIKKLIKANNSNIGEAADSPKITITVTGGTDADTEAETTVSYATKEKTPITHTWTISTTGNVTKTAPVTTP